MEKFWFSAPKGHQGNLLNVRPASQQGGFIQFGSMFVALFAAQWTVREHFSNAGLVIGFFVGGLTAVAIFLGLRTLLIYLFRRHVDFGAADYSGGEDE